MPATPGSRANDALPDARRHSRHLQRSPPSRPQSPAAPRSPPRSLPHLAAAAPVASPATLTGGTATPGTGGDAAGAGQRLSEPVAAPVAAEPVAPAPAWMIPGPNQRGHSAGAGGTYLPSRRPVPVDASGELPISTPTTVPLDTVPPGARSRAP